MSIGDNVREYRKQRGLTQFELADAAHISRSYLGDIERGRYHPSVAALQQIADVLKVPTSSLLDGAASLAELVAADNDLQAAYDLLRAGGNVSPDQLSRAKQQLISSVVGMSDEQVAALQAVVDQIISDR